MNMKTQKERIAASLLLLMGAATPALASSTGPQALGFPANSIDVWTFTCAAGTNGAAARVTDNAPVHPALMQVVLGKDSLPTVPGAAPNEGQSSLVSVTDGSGVYTVAFKKTIAGAENYTGEVFCAVPVGPLPLLINVSDLQRRINQ